MKRKVFSKPFKLGALTFLTASASLTPAICLTSCNEIRGVLMDATDEETGISSILYDSMKKQFRRTLEDKLRRDISLTEEEIQRELAALDTYLVTFDEELKMTESGVHPIDYTSATMALSELASQKYQILLNRRCSVTLSSFRDEYKMLRDSTYRYMRNQGLLPADIERILTDCDNRFNNGLMKSVQKEYSHDPLLGITKSQNALLELFDACNAEVALVASVNKLTEFVDKFTFEFNPKATDDGYYDVLKEKLIIDAEIPTDVMRNVFICREKQTGDPYDFDPKNMCPGFVVTPHLAGWYADSYSNQYAMEIDWTAYPSIYDEEEELQQYKDIVTAHFYGENKEIAEGTYPEDKPFNEIIQESEIQTMRYSVQAHDYYEREQLVSTYFNSNDKNNHIYLDWRGGPKNRNNKYECFFDGMTQNVFTGTLTAQSLANSGLQISSNNVVYEPLSDVMNRVELDNQDPEHARPDSELGLCDKFVKYCVLKSETTSEDGTSLGDHKVHHNFYYQYSNSIYEDKGIVTDPDYGKDKRRSDGFLPSDKFFDIANEKFNETYSLFVQYRDNKFYEIKDKCLQLEASFISTTAMTAVQIAACVIKCIFGGIATKVMAAYTIGLLGANAAVLGLIWPLYTRNLIDPINDFVDKVYELKHRSGFQKIQARLAQDEHWFCIYDKEGKRPRDYDTKRTTFLNQNFVTTTRPLFQYYSTVMDQSDFLEFKQNTIDLKCDPKEFKKQFGTWKYTGKQYLVNYGYCAIRFGISSLIFDDPTPLAWLAAEFFWETGIGYVITSTLQETTFNYPYRDK